MSARLLITSDLHLTDKKEDEYKWRIFPWLVKKAKKKNISNILILGDLTDSKDKHPSILVNRLVRNLHMLTSNGFFVTILKGNHDYIEKTEPFFNFVGASDQIIFVTYPTETEIEGERCLFLPHTKAPKKDWEPFNYKFCDYDFVFLHQTIEGAVASNGFALPGLKYSDFKNVKKYAISGDIHVPQKIGGVTYVGAPYQIKFGDDFDPRVLLYNSKKLVNLRFKTTRKEVIQIKDPEELEAELYDKKTQIKVKVKLRREDFSDWSSIKERIREICRKKGWDLKGVEIISRTGKQSLKKIKRAGTHDRKRLFKKFCNKQKVDDHTFKIGKALLND